LNHNNQENKMSTKPEAANDSVPDRRTLPRGLEAGAPGAPEICDLENRRAVRSGMKEFMKNRAPAAAKAGE